MIFAGDFGEIPCIEMHQSSTDFSGKRPGLMSVDEYCDDCSCI